jgi:hypothetical protein
MERAIDEIEALPNAKLRRLARCALLKTGQWAIDCKQALPTAEEFRFRFVEAVCEATTKVALFTKAAKSNEHSITGSGRKKVRMALRCATQISATLLDDQPPIELVLTSPPYVGTHVLYHRWQVFGRKETPAPFWLAGLQDGYGGSHYTIGDYRTHDDYYYETMESVFTSLRPRISRRGYVIQLLGFPAKHYETRYLEMMTAAGYEAVTKIRRTLPRTRRFYTELGHVKRTSEVALIHRKA